MLCFSLVCGSKPRPLPTPPHSPNNPTPSSFPSDRSKAVRLLQFFFVLAAVVSYVAFVRSLFAHYISFFRCLVKIVLRDFGIS